MQSLLMMIDDKQELINELESRLEAEIVEKEKLKALCLTYRDQFRALARQLAGVPKHV